VKTKNFGPDCQFRSAPALFLLQKLILYVVDKGFTRKSWGNAKRQVFCKIISCFLFVAIVMISKMLTFGDSTELYLSHIFVLLCEYEREAGNTNLRVWSIAFVCCARIKRSG